ncbi:hypothetical protein [Rhodoblastus sp.]|uniref:hypothetical protein n=1 Tax=Rhodoblastus sp. TaxID=1962975 RepID=UPI003F9AC7FE
MATFAKRSYGVLAFLAATLWAIDTPVRGGPPFYVAVAIGSFIGSCRDPITWAALFFAALAWRLPLLNFGISIIYGGVEFATASAWQRKIGLSESYIYSSHIRQACLLFIAITIAASIAIAFTDTVDPVKPAVKAQE